MPTTMPARLFENDKWFMAHFLVQHDNNCAVQIAIYYSIPRLAPILAIFCVCSIKNIFRTHKLPVSNYSISLSLSLFGNREFIIQLLLKWRGFCFVPPSPPSFATFFNIMLTAGGKVWSRKDKGWPSVARIDTKVPGWQGIPSLFHASPPLEFHHGSPSILWIDYFFLFGWRLRRRRLWINHTGCPQDVFGVAIEIGIGQISGCQQNQWPKGFEKEFLANEKT